MIHCEIGMLVHFWKGDEDEYGMIDKIYKGEDNEIRYDIHIPIDEVYVLGVKHSDVMSGYYLKFHNHIKTRK